MTNLFGFNTKNKGNITYPDVRSAIRPVPHSEEIPVPVFKTLDGHSSESSDDSCDEAQAEAVISSCDEGLEPDRGPQTFNQAELNDLVRDLDLPKASAELLASRLNEKNLLSPGTKVTFFRMREKDLVQYFSMEDDFVYCKDIPGLLAAMNCTHDPAEWRFFIDSSKESLKCVLLHNGNQFASIPVGHSVVLKETYENLATVLQKIKYDEYNWDICGDLKVIGLLLGQQSGYTKYPCFLCMWDSRARDKHWTQKVWPPREEFKAGEKNIKHQPLVDPRKVLLPPLHIKLGLMKQFVKALDKDGSCFKYLCDKFPALTNEKIKAGVFDGPQIRQLLNDQQFVLTMKRLERNAWEGFTEVVTNFLGNTKSKNYRSLVKKLLVSYEKLGCNMSVKVHFLQSHLDYFPENLGAVSEEQGERFQQDIKTMEKRYQGQWNVSMMADYCWCLLRETDSAHSRKSKKRKFKP